LNIWTLSDPNIYTSGANCRSRASRPAPVINKGSLSEAAKALCPQIFGNFFHDPAPFLTLRQQKQAFSQSQKKNRKKNPENLKET
jgi:hypothetical protein